MKKKYMAQVLTDGMFNHSLSLYKKRDGAFILHPTGSIDRGTAPALQDAVDRIFESRPEMVLFDMKQVDYIDTHGLHVIFNAHQAMKRQGGRVGLMHLPPHIKKVFEIVNILPKQKIFESREELDCYLDAIQHRYTDCSPIEGLAAGMDNSILWTEIRPQGAFSGSSASNPYRGGVQ